MDQLKPGARKGITLLAIVALLAVSGLASASSDTDEDGDDTTFSFAYDEEFQVFLWNITVDDGEVDCSLEGSVDVTYGDPGPDGEITIINPSDTECEISGAEVTGPNGQVNRGMFLKLFNSLYEGTGRGCLVRYIAQSDLGMGDQQINVSDADDQFESASTDDTSSVEFSTFSADCERGKSGEAKDSASNGRGRPEFAGKSGEAPGRNK